MEERETDSVHRATDSSPGAEQSDIADVSRRVIVESFASIAAGLPVQATSRIELRLEVTDGGSLRVMATEGSEVTPTLSRYVLLNMAAQMTGYTVKAMERKIERGDWIEGKVWLRAPDGRILIDMLGFQRWVEGH